MLALRNILVALIAFIAISQIYAEESTTSQNIRGVKRQLQGWYELDRSGYQNPQNVQDMGGDRFLLKVAPGEEAVKLHSNQFYTGGRFEVSMKTASAMPGIITAFYLASSDTEVQRSDHDIGSQDEIDFEFLGNDLSTAHTNVFVDGVQQSQKIAIGNNHAESENQYAIEWDDTSVRFYINGGMVRSEGLTRPMKAMRMSLAVWSTTGGWQGLQEWAGSPPDWNSRGNAPIEASFQVLSFPY
jgi:beta-glucanase (GH16 family)